MLHEYHSLTAPAAWPPIVLVGRLCHAPAQLLRDAPCFVVISLFLNGDGAVWPRPGLGASLAEASCNLLSPLGPCCRVVDDIVCLPSNRSVLLYPYFAGAFFVLRITRYYGFNSVSHPGCVSVALPYTSVPCHIYVFWCSPPCLPPLWLCSLLLPPAVVWMCSVSQKREHVWYMSLLPTTRLQLPWRSPVHGNLFSCSVVRLRTPSMRYMCSFRFSCYWLGHVCCTVPVCVVSLSLLLDRSLPFICTSYSPFPSFLLPVPPSTRFLEKKNGCRYMDKYYTLYLAQPSDVCWYIEYSSSIREKELLLRSLLLFSMLPASLPRLGFGEKLLLNAAILLTLHLATRRAFLAR